MEQKQFIQKTYVENLLEDEIEVYEHQKDYSWAISPDKNDLIVARAQGEELIEIKSDDHKSIFVKIDDIKKIELIENPNYKEETEEIE